MEERSADQVQEALRAAYEAGRAAVRHFDQGKQNSPRPTVAPAEQQDWHH